MKTNSNRLQNLVCLLIFSLLLVPAGAVNACCLSGLQEEEVTQEADVMERVKELCTDIKRQAVQAQLTMQIERLESLLKLEERQVKKLSIAAKAVSGKQKEAWAKIMGEYDMWGELAASLGGDLEKFEDTEFSDFGKLPADLLYYLELNDLDIVTSSPARSKFWLKTLKSVLSEEQLKIYEEDYAKQNKKSLESLVAYVADNISRELVVDEDTKKKLTEFVEAELSDPPIQAKFLGMGSEVINLAMSRLSTADLEGLEESLTKNQLNRLRIKLAVYSPNGFFFVEEQDFEDEGLMEEDAEAEENAEADEDQMDDE